MKNLLKVLCAVAIGATLSGAALAQQAGPTGGGLQGGGKQGTAPKRGGGLKLNKEVLEKVQPALSTEQKTSLANLDKKTMDSLKSLREKGKAGDKEEMRAALKKAMTEHREGLLKILTPAQQESYKKLYREAVAKNRKDGKGGKDGKGIG